MKKILIVLFTAFGFTQTINAQGNLQFSRIVNIEFTKKILYQSQSYYVDTSVVVPTNKIWKVEAVRVGASADSTFFNYSNLIIQPGSYIHTTLNGAVLTHAASYGSLSTTESPIYLQSGTYKIGLTTFLTYPYAFTGKTFISAIEYNIIP